MKGKATLTAHQLSEIQRRRTSLSRQIDRFRPLQLVYMPGVKRLMGDVGKDVEVEDIKLWLPSEMDAISRAASCIPHLADTEVQLRKAQCADALSKIRNLVRAKTHVIQFRNKNVRGQRPNTRAAGAISRLEQKLSLAVEIYRRAHTALLSLLGSGEWENNLKVLRDEDIRSPGSVETSIDDPNDTIGPNGKKKTKKQIEALSKGLGESRRIISWIWVAEGLVGEGADTLLNEGEYQLVPDRIHTDIY